MAMVPLIGTGNGPAVRARAASPPVSPAAGRPPGTLWRPASIARRQGPRSLWGHYGTEVPPADIGRGDRRARPRPATQPGPVGARRSCARRETGDRAPSADPRGT